MTAVPPVPRATAIDSPAPVAAVNSAAPVSGARALDLRTVTDAEFPDWLRAARTGFLRPPSVTGEEVALRRATTDLGRTLGVFDGARCVATLRSFPQRLTAAGGVAMAASAVTQVTVSPTHRRRGLLNRLIAAELAAARERGEPLATLVAAEYPIYGRYGFGPATRAAEWTVDLTRAGLDPRRPGPGREDGGRVELVDPAEARRLAPGVHDRLRAVRAGVIDRSARRWDLLTGAVEFPGDPWREPFFAFHRAASGEIDGYAAYTADERWADAKQPMVTATVRDLIAADPAAERALWEYLFAIDWVTTVRTGLRAPDDLVPDLLPDPRAAGLTTEVDLLWVRVLDVVRALEARTYATDGALVLDVRDPSGPADGRYLLTAGPGGAECVRTDRDADLVLPVRELGALLLGEGSAVRLAALGRVTEERPGAAALAELLFRTARRPWCPDIF
ncbi:GNAT family N-acetyltransferase [Streptomyces sp. LP05-1]|uniref:GNAT family N-acetyltransferase n=1 Tax=Streptomyces pyxinae TaxID=2970734 RepID=A0ABT2CMY9_9ACTN|nr:GNAT family N-acetyltransferase [Streptomyces sp. LP05-1]MCS0638789.1 GNAT family N-acetyltransferase [Streptomyces sp. LP05-1]